MAVKRISFFVFYEKNGFVSEYVKYYIKNLKKISEKIFIIVNGSILPNGKKTLEDNGAEVIIRKNEGLDFGAWKDGLLKYGLENIKKFDELILCNCTCYGPIFSLQDVFYKMERRNCDFWGITKHAKTENLLIPNIKESAIQEHIQTYFLVINKNVINSECFVSWWTNLKVTNNYLEEVAYHENVFTQYLFKHGFKYSTYVNCEKYFKRDPNFNIVYSFAYDLIKFEHCPFVKRKTFTNFDYVWTNLGEGFTPLDVLREVKQAGYPLSNIFSDLFRTQKYTDVKDSLALNWVQKKRQFDTKHNTALVCFASSCEWVKYIVTYICNMPFDSDLYIISTEEDIILEYKNNFSKIFDVHRKFFYLIKKKQNFLENNAENIVLFLKKYEGFCFIHDCISDKATFSNSRDFLRRNLICCLDNKCYVNDLIAELLDSSNTGLMIPPTIFFSEYIKFLNPENEKKFILKNKFNFLNFYKNAFFDQENLLPHLGIFWVRNEAIKDLIQNISIFKKLFQENNSLNDIFFEKIEYIISYFVLNSGYIIKWALPTDFAELFINNICYRLRDFQLELNNLFGEHTWLYHLTFLRSLKNDKSETYLTTLHKNLDGLDLEFRYLYYIKCKLFSKLLKGKKKMHYYNKYRMLKHIKQERHIHFF